MEKEENQNNSSSVENQDITKESKKPEEIPVEENKQEVIGDEWWEEGYEVKSEIKSSVNNDTGDLCGHPGCDKSVSAFDFRCYTCRNRFCPEHAGSSIDCQKCSS